MNELEEAHKMAQGLISDEAFNTSLAEAVNYTKDLVDEETGPPPMLIYIHNTQENGRFSRSVHRLQLPLFDLIEAETRNGVFFEFGRTLADREVPVVAFFLTTASLLVTEMDGSNPRQCVGISGLTLDMRFNHALIYTRYNEDGQLEIETTVLYPYKGETTESLPHSLLVHLLKGYVETVVLENRS